MDKHHRSTYPDRDSIPSSRAFDLIHCDVWGPSRVPSPTSLLYYVVFVDDYTRSARYISSKIVRQVLDIVRQFTQEIITQHSTTPKVIRDSIPSSRASDLIHCDVWGPSRVPSPPGHLY